MLKDAKNPKPHAMDSLAANGSRAGAFPRTGSNMLMPGQNEANFGQDRGIVDV